MNKVIIRVNQHEYPVICGAGQEERVRDLAQMIDARATQIAAASPQTGEAMILLLSALMLADEIQELRQQNELALQREDATILKLDLLTDRIHQIATMLGSIDTPK